MFSKELFAERLYGLRKKAGETQDVLGRVIGVGKTHISEMEQGQKTTTVEKIAMICEHYNISADYLLGLSDTPRKLK